MEEMLDVFSIDGSYLGVKSRSFCHSENPCCFHKPVWIWIKEMSGGGRILLQKRAMSKKKSPGKWDMPSAGHVDAGETCLQGCVRETKEELGIEAKETDFIFLKEFVNKKGWELAQVYLFKTDMKAEDMKIQKEEVECVKWFEYDEFVKMLYSEKFCNHPKEYKDWVAEVLK